MNGLNNKNLFLIVRRLGISKIKEMLAYSVSLKSLLPSSQTTVFYLACPHVAHMIFYKGTNHVEEGPSCERYYITKPNKQTPSYWELSLHHMNPGRTQI